MKYKSMLWAIALATAVGFPQLGSTTSIDQLDLGAMTSEATTIVTAEVVDSQVDTSDNRLTTVLTLRVTDQIKGVTQNFISVTVPGGSAKLGRFRVSEVNASVPRIFADQEALLFLTESQQSNNYSVVGFTQGYMSILDDEGQQVVQNSTTDGKKLSLEEMKESIMQVEAE